jgi:hypothetical protein
MALQCFDEWPADYKLPPRWPSHHPHTTPHHATSTPQVTRLHSFAFPLAEVAVAVMAAHPDFVPLLAARLHQVRIGRAGVSLLRFCDLDSLHRNAGLLWPHAHMPTALPTQPCPPGGLPAAPMLQVCPLTVPKYRVFKSGADDDTYLKQLGYKISTDEDTSRVGAGLDAVAGCWVTAAGRRWVLKQVCLPDLLS